MPGTAAGTFAWAAERFARHDRPLERITTRDGVAMGFAQALALIPGVSRSGATITAGLFLGFDRPSAARFSFLLSVPAVVLSGLFEFATNLSDDQQAGLCALAIATLFAFIVGYASIAILLRYLTRHTTIVFVIYRVALGTLVLVLVATGAIH